MNILVLGGFLNWQRGFELLEIRHECVAILSLIDGHWHLDQLAAPEQVVVWHTQPSGGRIGSVGWSTGERMRASHPLRPRYTEKH